MRKQSIFGLVGILLAGGALGGVVLTTLNSGTQKVVVPITEIKAGKVFTSENLRTVDMPKRAVVPGVTITNMNDVVGKVAVGNVNVNEMVTESKVADTKGQAYVANMTNSKDNYTVQIPIPESTPIQGLSVGDYVSVLSSVKGEGNASQIVTGKIGTKYKVVGINEDGNGLIKGVVLEVEPANLSKISHALLNNVVILSLVSQENQAQPIPGATQQGLQAELAQQK